MKSLLMVILLVSTIKGNANDNSTWDLYRSVMGASEENEHDSEVIPEWLIRKTEGEAQEEIQSTTRTSFQHYIEQMKGFNPHAARGNDGPHGGDTYGSEFASIAMEIYKGLSKLDQKVVSSENFLKAVESVIIYSDESRFVKLRGQPVDALNFPNDLKILISRSRWREMVLKDKIRLVFHEYLGIINSERDVYKISIKFNKFFDELVTELKEKRSQFYYGLCTASLALSFEGEPCSTELDQVKGAILCAKEKALRRCQLESYTKCEGAIILKQKKFIGIGIPTC